MSITNTKNAIDHAIIPVSTTNTKSAIDHVIIAVSTRNTENATGHVINLAIVADAVKEDMKTNAWVVKEECHAMTQITENIVEEKTQNILKKQLCQIAVGIMRKWKKNMRTNVI